MIKKAMLLWVVLLAATGWAAGQMQGLASGVQLWNGTSGQFADLMSSPAVVDWNNDGRKDLIVGQFTNGYIGRYLNIGADAAPSFNNPTTYLLASGIPITTSYG